MFPFEHACSVLWSIVCVCLFLEIKVQGHRILVHTTHKGLSSQSLFLRDNNRQCVFALIQQGKTIWRDCTSFDKYSPVTSFLREHAWIQYYACLKNKTIKIKHVYHEYLKIVHPCEKKRKEYTHSIPIKQVVQDSDIVSKA